MLSEISLIPPSPTQSKDKMTQKSPIQNVKLNINTIDQIYLPHNIIKTYLTLCSLQAQMCGFNSFVLKVWPQYSRVVEIICACDGGMHSACRGCGLNGPAVSSVLCAL